VSQTAWMIYGPQGRWIEHLDDGPWRVEEILAPFGGWQGTYLNWRGGCWPADVERYLLDASRRDRMPLLGCYVQVSDFGYVVGLVAGEVVARYVVNPRRTQVWIEGGWALEQCAAHHGPDWQRTGLDALARWSQVAPRPLAVEQLAPLLAAEHLFPEHPLLATCRMRWASCRRPSRCPGRGCRSADRLRFPTAEVAGIEGAGLGKENRKQSELVA
jgi:hypothetical protein